MNRKTENMKKENALGIERDKMIYENMERVV